MSAREKHIHRQMVTADVRKSEALKRAAKEAGKPIPAAITTEPLETAFFLPTKQDVAMARKWQRRLGDRPNHEMRALFTAIRLIGQGTAVSLSCLETLRQFDRDREEI